MTTASTPQEAVTQPAPPHDSGALAPADVDAAGATLEAVRGSVAKAIIGQDEVIELALAAILAGGHALLVGAPGLAKTKLVGALAAALGLDTTRIQFTPDLMPSDILGAEILDQDEAGRRAFRFERGPVFTQLLMADEINRASPRTQSALLQAMEERHVSVAGARHDLPAPFHVLATENPIEQEGTYPLPEAQLDRFLFQIDVDYPSRDEERTILLATTGPQEAAATPVLSGGEELMALQRLVRAMPVGEAVVEAVLDVVRAARPHDTPVKEVREGVAWGPGPRAAQALKLGACARALLQGRLSPTSADVVALAGPALKHRMALSFAGREEGLTVPLVVDRVVASVA